MTTGVGSVQENGARSSLELLRNIGLSVSHTVGPQVVSGAVPASPGQTSASAVLYGLTRSSAPSRHFAEQFNASESTSC
jgi:hypothetical protein